MSTTFSTADNPTTKLLDSLVQERFPDLAEVAVTFTVLFARNAESPPVKFRGVPAAASIRVNGLCDRVEGKADITIKLDVHQWEDANAREREATLYGVLLYVELVRGEDGGVETDDAARPRVKISTPDFQVAGFHKSVEVYGAASVEYRGVRTVAAKWMASQLWGDW